MRLRNMTIYSHCSTMLMIARVLQMPKISWCFISSLFGSVLKEKKLFLQSFSALYSHFCWNHFSFGFLLRTSPYVTFVVFVVIFIYIIVKYSLYLGILLHLGFVLLRAYHTRKKKYHQKEGLVAITIAIAAVANVVNDLTIDLFTEWTKRIQQCQNVAKNPFRSAQRKIHWQFSSWENKKDKQKIRTKSTQFQRMMLP